MNKAQFVEAIALDANISKIDARKVIKFRPTAEVE